MHIKYKTGPVKIRKFEQISNKKRYCKEISIKLPEINSSHLLGFNQSSKFSIKRFNPPSKSKTTNKRPTTLSIKGKKGLRTDVYLFFEISKISGTTCFIK